MLWVEDGLHRYILTRGSFDIIEFGSKMSNSRFSCLVGGFVTYVFKKLVCKCTYIVIYTRGQVTRQKRYRKLTWPFRSLIEYLGVNQTHGTCHDSSAIKPNDCQPRLGRPQSRHREFRVSGYKAVGRSGGILRPVVPQCDG